MTQILMIISIFPDVVICCNSFDKGLPISKSAEFCVLITSLVFNGFLLIFNNILAEGVEIMRL